jgi:ElaB/YqjD/DUF883 family membrane-anchored ribosome-binding protein
MINPNGDEFTEDNPLAASMGSMEEGASARLRQAAGKVSTAAGEAWEQTKQKAGTARDRTEFFVRENPVPTLIGALALGVAIGFAIRYASTSEERDIESKPALADADWRLLSLPFLWPVLKAMRRRCEDSADVVKDGVDRLKRVKVDKYVKPLRKKWKAWAN